MATQNGYLHGLAKSVVSLLFRGARASGEDASPSDARAVSPDATVSPGQAGSTATREIDPPGRAAVRVTYAPQRDGDPDAGEVVWTWVPYEENDGRGKDRPVLVVARQSADRVFAVRLTSKAHEGDRDYLSIGAGAWDSKGRPSWIDIEHLYSVHAEGMRREAVVLDLDRFAVVAQALQRRYGWEVGD
ncbi:MAG: type II toxin-antitoxin system PemK/MazF family toxin [Microbacterium sp.]